MNDEKIYDVLKGLWEQNSKPHMIFLVLNIHKDMNFHRGAELMARGYDTTEVYDTIELLVAKGNLTRFGKKTKITPKGLKILEFVYEIIDTASKIVIRL